MKKKTKQSIYQYKIIIIIKYFIDFIQKFKKKTYNKQPQNKIVEKKLISYN